MLTNVSRSSYKHIVKRILENQTLGTKNNLLNIIFFCFLNSQKHYICFFKKITGKYYYVNNNDMMDDAGSNLQLLNEFHNKSLEYLDFFSMNE
jgi:hypothetical protein